MQLVIAFSVLFATVNACGDGHDHGAGQGPVLTPPSRPLDWGDINILHTTDTHGWLLGHQKTSFPEPNYSGDLGDFASFENDVDLLLIDSGDVHDGTGLSDGFPPGEVDAHESNDHELYVYANTLDMHQNFAPALNGRYLSSDVNITFVDNNNNLVNVPVGERFAKFETRKGRSVTALGVLFDFTGNDKNTTVQKVADMVKESWFMEAIQDEPDFFLLVGHMPVARDNCPSNLWDKSGNLTFSRRYLDPNRVTYEFHTRRDNGSFHTDQGRSISQGLQKLAKRFDLNFTYGTAPHDFTISQAPYPSDNSSLSLYIEEAVPAALAINNTRASIPHIIITNSGSQRFDIYAGPFTKNDQFTVSPFSDTFLYIPGIPLSVAAQVLPTLNSEGANGRRDLDRELFARGYVGKRYIEWLEEMDRRSDGPTKRATQNLTLGYVTHDSCPGVGDDTLHAPLAFFSFPDFIASRPPDVAQDTPINLVFVQFLEDQLLGVLNQLQSNKTFTTADVQLYSNILGNQALGLYAQAAWN
ncbi:hypothetical protein L218DRAFT_1029835 [Marasmius fiardii PR-910]|nr:hypothetical protein L218DRAFT_1029835 [Marasmius fiardii PR-910]